MDSSAGLSFLSSLWNPPASPAECRRSNVRNVRMEDRSHLPVHIRRVRYREAFEQWQLCSCSPLITNSPCGQCGLHNSVTPTRPEKPHQLNEPTSLTKALLNSWSVWQIVSAHYSGESFSMHNSLGNLNFYIFKSLWSSWSRIKCLHCLFYSCWLLEEVVVDVCVQTHAHRLWPLQTAHCFPTDNFSVRGTRTIEKGRT